VAGTTTGGDSYEERINYFKVKEAELRCKEQQLATEAKKIEVNKAQDELKYMREVHRLRVEELKMKIRILQKEEEQLRKCSNTWDLEDISDTEVDADPDGDARVDEDEYMDLDMQLLL